MNDKKKLLFLNKSKKKSDSNIYFNFSKLSKLNFDNDLVYKINVTNFNIENSVTIKNNNEIYLFNEKEFDRFFFDFDVNYYKNNNLELNELSNSELKFHYYKFGMYQRKLYNDKIKIVIVSDPWKEGHSFGSSFGSGGNTSLYYLANMINNNNNFKGKIYCKMYNFCKDYTENKFCNYYALKDEINKNTIVIYPDGNEYNPLNAKNVIRWIILEIGTNYRDKIFFKKWNPNDLVYHWQPTKPNIKILNNTYINPSFINLKIKRNKDCCYLIKKRRIIEKKIIYVHPKNSLCIDDLPINES